MGEYPGRRVTRHMPWASEKQRRYMWSQHPEIAEKFAEEGKNYVKKKKKKRAGMGGSDPEKSGREGR